jgi:hypothetical protein
MYRHRRNQILALALIIAGGLVSAPKVSADSGRRIDATHILAREIELPESSGLAAVSGVSQADSGSVSRRANYKIIGQKEAFWVRNIATGQFDQVTAVLKASGKHCHIYVEESQNVSQKAIEKIEKRFDEEIYPTNTANFGNEARPGIDRDPKINLLLVDIQDGYTKVDDNYVAGYFFAGDQMYQSDFQGSSKTKSNEREILYIDTYPCDPEAEDYLEIVAHEFQHMIHYNRDKNEVTWVNEGCSQIAPVFCGFQPPGHYKLLKDDPDRSLNNWAQWNPMPDYGQVYLWNQFIVDRFLPDYKKRASFFKTLVGSKRKSIGGYIEALQLLNYSFTELFTDFSIANRINEPRLGDGQYAYRHNSLKKFKLPPTGNVNTFPAKISDSVFVWGSDAYYTDISNISSRLKISFSGYRRFLGPTYPYFRLAAVMQDSTGIQPPQIRFFQLNANPADKNRLIGSIEIDCNGTYDSLTLIIMAMAPEDIDDTKYMPAAGFIYDLYYESLTPISNVAEASYNMDMQGFSRAIAATADDYTENSMKIREQYANMLIRTVKRDLEKGSLQTVDSFIETATDRALLAPFARDICGMLLFFKNQQSSSLSDEELQNRIDFLSEFR